MSNLFGNHIVGFLLTRLTYICQIFPLSPWHNFHALVQLLVFLVYPSSSKTKFVNDDFTIPSPTGNEPRHANISVAKWGTLSSGFPPRSDSNRAVQSLTMARGWETKELNFIQTFM